MHKLESNPQILFRRPSVQSHCGEITPNQNKDPKATLRLFSWKSVKLRPSWKHDVFATLGLDAVSRIVLKN
jgi:hypothetical protein